MKFEKGKSGNPAGRRPGTGKHQQFRKILEAKAPELLERAIEMALEGDQKMMAMCLDRVLPALRTVDTPGRLPDFGDAKTLEEKATAVMKAISDGEITVKNKVLRVSLNPYTPFAQGERVFVHIPPERCQVVT